MRLRISLSLDGICATLNVLKSLYDHNVTGRSTPVDTALIISLFVV